MDSSSLKILSTQNIAINLETFIISLIISIFLSFLVQQFYKRFSTTLSNKEEFSKNFIILAVTTTIIITIVKSSLALSLGLVGALSIVRFRAAIKEPEELVYLFLVIATGLGVGANQLNVTILGVIVSLIIIIFFNIFSSKRIKNLDLNIFQLSIIFNQKLSDEMFNKILIILNKNSKEVDFTSMSSVTKETSVHFEIFPNSAKSISIINKELNKQVKSSKVIFSRKENISL